MSKSMIVIFPPTKIKGNTRNERIKNLQDAMKNPIYLDMITFEELFENTVKFNY